MAGVMAVKRKWKVTSGNFGFSILDEGVKLGRYPTKVEFMNTLDQTRDDDSRNYSLEYDASYTEIDLIHNPTSLKMHFSLLEE